MLISGQVWQGPTLHWMLGLRSSWLEWRLAGGWCVEGSQLGYPLYSLPTPGEGGRQFQLARHCLLPLNCSGAQPVLHSFSGRVDISITSQSVWLHRTPIIDLSVCNGPPDWLSKLWCRFRLRSIRRSSRVTICNIARSGTWLAENVGLRNLTGTNLAIWG